MAFRSGDIVYFKECRNGSKPKRSQGARFKGHGIGLFLGHVGPFQKEPSGEDCVKLVGACGFLSFDDVAEFLGDEQAKLCVERYEKKYYIDAKPEVKGPDGESVLVAADGKTPLSEQATHSKLLLPPESAERLKQQIAQRKAGETVPVMTVSDIQKQIKALTPEQIRKALSDARTNAESQLKRPLTDAEVRDIDSKVCGALGVNPQSLQRVESSGETAETAGRETKTAISQPEVSKTPNVSPSQNEENPFAIARRETSP